tara:strand:+ start:361 stop:1479 length:1119 start_codon:yes stop_codon:yes gene_type:complete
MLDYLRKKILNKKHKARPIELKKKKLKSLISPVKYSSKLIPKKFKELNLQQVSYGKKNPNKFFYIIRRSPGAGFFSNLNFVVHNLYICDQLKMIPVIDMENYPNLYNCKVKIKNTKNSWNYFFEQPSKYSLKDVYKSKNVIICDNRTSPMGWAEIKSRSIFKYFYGFQFLKEKHKKIYRKYIRIKKEFTDKANRIVKKEFKDKKVLGVCFRGSDQKKSAYQPYTPTEKQMLYATKILLKKYKFKKIFVCTEDKDYLNFYIKKFGKKVVYNDSVRTTDKIDLFDNDNPKHRYKIGKGNLIDMLVLSKTDHLLFANSNIPYTAIFNSNRKIPYSLIDNGMKGNIFVSQVSWYVRKNLPSFLGGFKNEFKSFNIQ